MVRLFRKRLIPMECVELKQDEVIMQNEKVILTRWNTLKPRKDFSHGLSCYFLEKGYKVSKFIKEDGTLKYWYCDIIKTEYKKEEDYYLFTDLLADVILYPNGAWQVVDLDELAEAAEQELICIEEMKSALLSLDSLLKQIYHGSFSEIQALLNTYSE